MAKKKKSLSDLQRVGWSELKETVKGKKTYNRLIDGKEHISEYSVIRDAQIKAKHEPRHPEEKPFAGDTKKVRIVRDIQKGKDIAVIPAKGEVPDKYDKKRYKLRTGWV